MSTETKDITIDESEREITVDNIEAIITLHDYMKRSFNWKPPCNERSRRWYEKSHSKCFEGKFRGHQVYLECKTSCSCANIYYRGYFIIDGRHCTIAKVRLLAKTGKQLMLVPAV